METRKNTYRPTDLHTHTLVNVTVEYQVGTTPHIDFGE